MQNPRQYKIPDWFLNRQKDIKDGKYSQVRDRRRELCPALLCFGLCVINRGFNTISVWILCCVSWSRDSYTALCTVLSLIEQNVSDGVQL